MENTEAARVNLGIDGYDDIRFRNQESFSASIRKDVVPGEIYELVFDYADATNVSLLGIDVRDCESGNLLLVERINGPDHYSFNFTVPSASSSKLRIKWLAYQPTAPGTEIVISKMALNGPANEYVPVIEASV